MEVYVIENPKGGTGKSAFVHCLAKVFIEEGLKVLLVDLDPQRSQTKDWEDRIEGFDEEANRYTGPTLYDFLSETDGIELEDLIRPIRGTDDRLWILPGSFRVHKIKHSVTQNKLSHDLFRPLAQKKKGDPLAFDIAICDNQSDWNQLVIASIAAADKLVVPVQLSRGDLEEAEFAVTEARKIRPDVEIAVVPNRVKNPQKLTKDDKEYLAGFAEILGPSMTRAMMPDSIWMRRVVDRDVSLSGADEGKQRLADGIRSVAEGLVGKRLNSSIF